MILLVGPAYDSKSFNKMLSYGRDTALQGALYNLGQKWKTGTGRQCFKDIIGLSSTTLT